MPKVKAKDRRVAWKGFLSKSSYLKYVERLRVDTLDGRCHNCWKNFTNEELTLGHTVMFSKQIRRKVS